MIFERDCPLPSATQPPTPPPPRQVTGSTQLQVVTVSAPGGKVERAPEVIQALYVDAANRVLYANVFVRYTMLRGPRRLCSAVPSECAAMEQ